MVLQVPFDSLNNCCCFSYFSQVFRFFPIDKYTNNMNDSTIRLNTSNA